MERSQALSKLHLLTVECQHCQEEFPTYRVVKMQKEKKPKDICLNCVKSQKSEIRHIGESIYESGIKIINKIPTPDYHEAEYCISLATEIEKSVGKVVQDMGRELKKMEEDAASLCKEIKIYCETYINKVKNFESWNFQTWHKGISTQNKFINQKNYFFNLRQKLKTLVAVKKAISQMDMQIPNIEELVQQSKQKKDVKNRRICGLPITAMTNAKGRNYFGTADGGIIYEGYEQLLQYQGHESLIRSFSFDGQFTLFSGSDDFNIKAWDLHGERIQHLKTFGMLENRSYHRDILVVGGGDFLVSTRGQFDGFKLRVWSLKDDYESTGCLEGHSNFIRSMIPTSQGQIVTVSDDRSLRVWHFRQAYPLRQYFHNYKIHHVLLNEEQDMLVIIDENNKVTVLSFQSLDILYAWIMPRKVLCCASSPSHIILAPANQIGFWDWSFEKVHSIDLETVFHPNLMMLVHDRLIVADGTGNVNQYQIP